MHGQSTQPELFAASAPRIHCLDGAELKEFPAAFSKEESEKYFNVLLQNINWKAASIRIAGRQIPIPRLQCWIAGPGQEYRYSGIRMAPESWSATLLEIRDRVQALSGESFNAVLANLYRSGEDSVSWHADDEPELGPAPVIASVSFGASRPFLLKSTKKGKPERLKLTLHDGTLLVMGKGIQNKWLHQLPKVKGLVEPRINLTFRQLLT